MAFSVIKLNANKGPMGSGDSPATLASLPEGPKSKSVGLFGKAEAPPSRLPQPLVEALHHTDRALRKALGPESTDPDQLWQELSEVHLSPDGEHGLLIFQHQSDPVGILYDTLRTRLLQVTAERGWRRIGVIAPTRGCGASTLTANLALALGRRPSGRTLLIDLDLRAPGLAGLFGIKKPGRLRDVFEGRRHLEDHLQRHGRSLALALNDGSEMDAAEVLQEPDTLRLLADLTQELDPEIVICDLPPLLEGDEALAILPQMDAILLVADGLHSTPAQIKACEAILHEKVELLGVVMNRAEDSPVRIKRPFWRFW